MPTFVIVARLYSAATCGGHVPLQHRGLGAGQVTQHRPGGQRRGDHRGQLISAVRRGHTGPDGAGQVLLQLGQPLLGRRVEQLQQHGLAGLEVAQHVGLGQPDAAAQLVEGDLGHRHLGQHGGRGVEDRPAPQLALLFAAGPLEHHHARILQTAGPL